MKLLMCAFYSAIVLSLFLLGCQAEKIAVSEVASKTEDAIVDIKSLTYETEITQTFSNLLDDDITYESIITGKYIKEQAVSEIIIKSLAADQEVEIQYYLTEDTFYYYDPDSGWMQERFDGEDDLSINMEQEHLFEPIGILLELGIDEVYIEENKDVYLITYQGDHEQIAKKYKKEFLDSASSITKDLDTMLALAGSIGFSDFQYAFSIDKDTFLPEAYSISYRLKVKLSDEFIYVDYEKVTRYLQYDSLKAEDIVIPEID